MDNLALGDILQPTSSQIIRAALIGNPNTGKTTLFNRLTGLNQKTGNYPGVTVERKIGRFTLGGRFVDLIDLPGSYSLAARSPDEILVSDILLGRRPDEDPVNLVIVIVDASNIQRNFYLLSQVFELGLPVVVALNMIDIAQSQGVSIDADALSRRLGAPVVPLSARRNIGLQELTQAIQAVISDGCRPPSEKPSFPYELRQALVSLRHWVQSNAPAEAPAIPEPELFRALIDRGGYAEQRLQHRLGADFLNQLEHLRERCGKPTPLSSLEVKSRYDWINAVLQPCIKKSQAASLSSTDRIDRILTHRLYGSLVFFVLMALMFQSIYSWAAPIMDSIDAVFGAAGLQVARFVPEGALQ
ncbi:MAG: FeoB small GTPase domain-containing protein, partial [Candidatus Hinthialibacter sp.]